jgi:hypothetical protein
VSDLSIELLTQERAIELWPKIAPLAEKSALGNVMTASDMDSQYIFNAVCADEAVIFAGFENGELATILGIQFSDANGHKCADIIAMAGRRLTKFKQQYWGPILDWLKANEVEFLDSYVPTERAMIYMNKFGFDKSCAHIRMSLGNQNG